MSKQPRHRENMVELSHSDVQQTVWVMPESVDTWKLNGWTLAENGVSKPESKPVPVKQVEPAKTASSPSDNKE